MKPTLWLAVLTLLSWPVRAAELQPISIAPMVTRPVAQAREQRAAAERQAKGQRFKESFEILGMARLDYKKLMGTMGYTPDDLVDLADAIKQASMAARRLHAEFPLTMQGDSARWGIINGVSANIEDTVRYFASKSNQERGCLSHQGTTFDALLPLQGKSGLESRKIMFGKVLEHHAVIVFPKGSEWARTGIVLDAWIRQDWKPADMTFYYQDWEKYSAAGLLVPRLED